MDFELPQVSSKAMSGMVDRLWSSRLAAETGVSGE
jgi:hypothetical protein